MSHTHFALITGSSEGFGRCLAIACAKRNMNLLLVALPGSGLPTLAAQIANNFNVTVQYFETDLCHQENCYALYTFAAQKGIQVNFLINNAGIGGTHGFDERSPEFYHRQIALNVTATTILTRLFLKDLCTHQPSWVLNVGSLASFFALPGKQVYAGTKSYVLSFSASLRRELKEFNVCVATVCPGAMPTTPLLAMQIRNGSAMNRWSSIPPEKVAQITLKKLFQGKEIIIPGKLNKLFLIMDRIIPSPVKDLLVQSAMRRIRMDTQAITLKLMQTNQ